MLSYLVIVAMQLYCTSINVVLAQDCDYCSLGVDNTYCQNLPRSESCGMNPIVGVTLPERQVILDLHNTIRRNIAKGTDPNFMFTASNMKELVWDEELAEGARLWAEQCPFGTDHDINRDVCRFEVEQNTYFMPRLATKYPNWTEAILGEAGWYSEVNNFQGDPNMYSDPGPLTIGNFAQLIWAETQYVGCYYIAETYANYVCNYGPSGLHENEPMFLQGEACSQCEAGSICNDGLCALDHSGSTPIGPELPLEQQLAFQQSQLTYQQSQLAYQQSQLAYQQSLAAHHQYQDPYNQQHGCCNQPSACCQKPLSYFWAQPYFPHHHSSHHSSQQHHAQGLPHQYPSHYNPPQHPQPPPPPTVDQP